MKATAKPHRGRPRKSEQEEPLPTPGVSVERWDRFFQTQLTKISEPNPELRRDLALDETVRALGPRPGSVAVRSGLDDEPLVDAETAAFRREN